MTVLLALGSSHDPGRALTGEPPLHGAASGVGRKPAAGAWGRGAPSPAKGPSTAPLSPMRAQIAPTRTPDAKSQART